MKKNSLQGELSVAKRVRFCDYNCTDSYGWTPLEIAAVLGHAPLVRYFSEAGVYLKTTKGEKAITNEINKPHCRVLTRKKALERLKINFLGGCCREGAISKTIKECWRQ